MAAAPCMSWYLRCFVAGCSHFDPEFGRLIGIVQVRNIGVGFQVYSWQDVFVQSGNELMCIMSGSVLHVGYIMISFGAAIAATLHIER